MIRRSTKIVLEVLAASVTVLLVAVGVLLWRLTTGPITVDFLTPHIEDALSAESGQVSVSIGTTELRWVGWSRHVSITALDVAMYSVAGERIGHVPEAAVSLSARALVRGDVALTRVRARRPEVRISRRADGRFVFGGDADESEPATSGPAVVGGFLESALAPLGSGSFGWLRRVNVENGRLSVVDEVSNRVWAFPQVNLSLERRRDSLSYEAAARVRTDDGGEIELRSTGDFAPGEDVGRLVTSFSGLKPATLAPIMPASLELDRARLPISGRVTLTLGRTGTMEGMTLGLRGGAGEIVLPAPYAEPLPVKRVSLDASFDKAEERLTLHDLTVDLDGPVLRADGVVSAVGGVGRVDGTVSFHDLPVEQMDTYWRPGMADNTRRWVMENIHFGFLDEVRAGIVARVPDAATAVSALAAIGERTTVDAVDGFMRYRGMTIVYLDGVSPVRRTSGTATFDLDRFHFDVESATLSDLTLEEATVDVDGMQTSNQDMAIVGRLRGALPTVLEVLDSERLQYASALGLEPRRVSGGADIEMRVTLPLIDALTFEHVGLEVDATLEDTSWRGADGDLSMEEGLLDLTLDKSGMRIDGTAQVGGIPGTVGWEERFGDAPPFRRRFRLQGPVDAAARTRLGMEVDDYVDGTLQADVTVTYDDSGRGVAEGAFDLTAAALSLPVFGRSKAAGEPGQASLTAQLDGDALRGISDLTLQTPRLDVTGALDLEPETRRLTSARLHVSSGPRNDADVTVTRRPDGLDVTVKGRSLDVDTVLGEDDPETESARAEEDASRDDVTLSVAVDRLYFAPDRSVDRATVEARLVEGRWTALSGTGAVGDGKRLAVHYRHRPDGALLAADSDDAGAALRALDIYDHLLGGRLKLRAASEVTEAGEGPLDGVARITGGRVKDAPAVLRILSVASLLESLSNEEGVRLSEFEADFRYENDQISVTRGRAKGPDVGLTLTGDILLAERSVDLKGTVVPSYMLNSILGNIPLVGDIFVGEEGSGVFAATYALDGSLDQPQVAVNPLAVLTPGFTRGLFNIFSAPPADVPADVDDVRKYEPIAR